MTTPNLSNFIIPNWPAPNNVHALQTNRHAPSGASSQAPDKLETPYDSFNLASHVNDNPIHVAQNRQMLSQLLPSEPVWLNQTHSIEVVNAANISCLDDSGYADCVPSADASFSTQKNVVCVVMTADCLPVLLCDKAAKIVVAVHAGWRGLCDGALEASIHAACKAAQIMPSDLMAWLGPAIGPKAFEVGAEVREQFMAKDAKSELAFIAHGENQEQDKWLCNIYQIATQRLNNVGVTQIYGGGIDQDFCTFSQKDQFFSYRRDGVTGRMATMIWLA
jgi:polyphenol oxidase